METGCKRWNNCFTCPFSDCFWGDEPQRPSTGVMQDMTFTFMTPFFGKKKSVEVGAGTDIDVLSEQISEIVEIRQRLGRINRYANKFKYWNESEDTNK